MDTELMRIFGPWLWWIFGVGLVLIIGGIAATLAARTFEIPLACKAGLLASGLGWRIVLVAVTAYVAIVALARVFDSMISSLPGG